MTEGERRIAALLAQAQMDRDTQPSSASPLATELSKFIDTGLPTPTRPVQQFYMNPADYADEPQSAVGKAIDDYRARKRDDVPAMIASGVANVASMPLKMMTLEGMAGLAKDAARLGQVPYNVFTSPDPVSTEQMVQPAADIAMMAPVGGMIAGRASKGASAQSLPEISPRFETEIGEGGRRYYRVMNGDQQIGHADVRAPSGGMTNVNGVFIDEQFQRRGIGSKLYDKIESDLAADGVTLRPSGTLALSPQAAEFWAKRKGGSSIYSNSKEGAVPGLLAQGQNAEAQGLRLYRGEGNNLDGRIGGNVDFSGGLGDAARGRWFTTSLDEARGTYAGKDGQVYYVDVPHDRVGQLTNSTLFPGEHYVVPEDIAAKKQRQILSANSKEGALPGLLSAGDRASGAEGLPGSAGAAGRPSSALSPNLPPSDPMAGGLPGHTPAGPQRSGPEPHSSMTGDLFPNASFAPWDVESYGVHPSEVGPLRERLRQAYAEGKIPDDWYVHGRARRGDLDTSNVLQLTRRPEVAESYAGKSGGSIWAIQPGEGRALDFSGTNTQDIRNVAASAIRDHRSGLPVAPVDDVLNGLGGKPSGREISQELRSNFAPERIVDSAQAFDNPDWINWLYDRHGPDFVRTPDGAVAMGPDGNRAVRLFSNPDEAALPGLLSSARAGEQQLPMDTASRMKRAQDMGFDTDTTWYHGTAKDFDAFSTGTAGSGVGSAGQPAVFLTPSPAEASAWARVTGGGNGDRVIPAHVGVKNTKTITGEMAPDLRSRQNPENMVYNTRRYEEELAKARAEGHDSVLFKNVDEGFPTGASDQLAVFDPAAIRSKFAAFDPAKRDSTNLLASNPREASPLAAALAGEQRQQPGITAYHGSPHDFDRFSMDKIGTGEGAQAYGHGLYFAEKEGVAKSYKDQLNHNPPGHYAAQDFLKKAGGDRQQAIETAQGHLDRHKANRNDQAVWSMEDAIARLSDPQWKPDPGHMYEVRINADPEHFLDWDKPIKEQPEKARQAVLDALSEKKGKPVDEEWMGSFGSSGTGIHTLLHNWHGRSDAAVAKALAERGIPGIRYLDQGSRTAGEGSRNFVVFDEKLIDIIRKYGWAAAAPLLAQMMAQDEPQQN